MNQLMWCRVLLAMLTCSACIGATGCASDGRVPPARGDAFMVEMMYRDDGNVIALYRVEEDGTFGFGGGQNALAERMSYTTILSVDDLDTLQLRIDEARWAYEDIESTNEPETRRYDIRYEWPTGWARHKVRGESQRIRPVHDLLIEFSERRLQRDLDTLPKPGIQRR
ncbi:MAG: hypothetical protein AAF432_08110 [Planctomycetota bacterium]